MDANLKTPLTAVVVIFICSCVAAVLAFKFLESTAGFQDSKGLQLGGAIVGLLVTFIALWRAFHTFSSELGKTDRERLEEQIKNLQNQIVRQNPAPAGYRRLLSEDFKLVAHIPTDWVTSDNSMIIFAPQDKCTLMDNIVIFRTLAKRYYRQLHVVKQKAALEASWDPASNLELQAQISALRAAPQHAAMDDAQSHDAIASLEAAAREKELQAKSAELDRQFMWHRDEPLREDEKIEDVLELSIEVNSSKTNGVPEHTEVDRHPAIRYQITNPVSEVVGRPIITLITEVFLGGGDGYVYQVGLTSSSETVSARTAVYNKIVSSISFFT